MPKKTASVTWLREMTFAADMEGMPLMLDEGDRGPSPLDLIMAGLAACTAMDMVMILQKARQPLESLVVHAEGERAEDHPRRFIHVVLTYELTGKGIDRNVAERAIRLSEEKYCSVSATLKEVAHIENRLVLKDD